MVELLETRAEVIKLLQNHEQTLSQLYKAYSETFPIQSPFWSGLSSEEAEHADKLSALESKLDQDHVTCNEDRFRAGGIRSSIGYIKGLIDEAKSGRIHLINALSVALDIEHSIIERKYFEAIDTDSAEVKKVLQILSEQTLIHIQKVQKAWESAR